VLPESCFAVVIGWLDSQDVWLRQFLPACRLLVSRPQFEVPPRNLKIEKSREAEEKQQVDLSCQAEASQTEGRALAEEKLVEALAKEKLVERLLWALAEEKALAEKKLVVALAEEKLIE
jgi:hypothetical protein